MTHWWRAYDHSVDNAKLQRLSGDLFKSWYNLCCLASSNAGVLPALADIAFKLRVSQAKARNVVETLQIAELIDVVDGVMQMHDWNEYQYKSDVSTERVKLWRKQKRNVSSNIAATPNETVSETPRSVSVSSSLSISEDSLESKEVSEEKATRRKKPKTLLPDDFQPDRDAGRKAGWSESKIDQQIQRFFDSAKAHQRIYADWPAAWRNWCSSDFQSPQSAGITHVQTDRDLGKSEFKQALKALGEYAEGRTGSGSSEAALRLLPPAGRRE